MASQSRLVPAVGPLDAPFADMKFRNSPRPRASPPPVLSAFCANAAANSVAAALHQYRTGMSSPALRPTTPCGVPALIKSPTPIPRHMRRVASVPHMVKNERSPSLGSPIHFAAPHSGAKSALTLPFSHSPAPQADASSAGQTSQQTPCGACAGTDTSTMSMNFCPVCGRDLRANTTAAATGSPMPIDANGNYSATPQFFAKLGMDKPAKFSSPKLVKPLAISPSRPQTAPGNRPVVTATILQFNSSPAFESPNSQRMSTTVKSPRVKYSQRQRELLLKYFNQNPRPCLGDMQRIAEEVNRECPNDTRIDAKNVKFWFTNTRTQVQRATSPSQSPSPTHTNSSSPATLVGQALSFAPPDGGKRRMTEDSQCSSPMAPPQKKLSRTPSNSPAPMVALSGPVTRVVIPNCTPQPAVQEGGVRIVQYSSLFDALHEACDRDTIIIYPGVYFASALPIITKELFIFGEGDPGGVIVEDDQLCQPMLVWAAGAGQVTNITFKQGGTSDKGLAVFKSQSTVSLSKCDFQCGPSGLVMEEYSSVAIDECLIHECTGSGIVAKAHSGLIVTRSRIYNNGRGASEGLYGNFVGLNGIDMEEGCVATIANNVIYNNAGYGVAMLKDFVLPFLRGAVAVKLEGNDISGNAGIMLKRDNKEIESLDDELKLNDMIGWLEHGEDILVTK